MNLVIKLGCVSRIISMTMLVVVVVVVVTESPALIQLTANNTMVSEGSSFQVCGTVLLVGSIGEVSITIPLVTDFFGFTGKQNFSQYRGLCLIQSILVRRVS